MFSPAQTERSLNIILVEDISSGVLVSLAFLTLRSAVRRFKAF